MLKSDIAKVNENCLIDLHLHLDGSLSIDTVKKLAKMQNITLPNTYDELLSKLRVSEECRDLNEYLEKFSFPLSLLQTTEAITESVYQFQEELKEQGLIYAEIRFAPQFHMQKGLTQEEIVKAAVEGLHKSSFEARLILCCMRGDNNEDQNIETVKLAKKYLDNGVVAIDLAGAEALYSIDKFKNIFKLANNNNIPFTIHAGEASGAESVKIAVEYGAKRIGHGVRAIEDLDVIRTLIEKDIVLELCPTSNINTCIYEDLKDYPIKKFIDAGVKVTLNTDNMTVSNTSIRKEIRTIAEIFSLTDKDIKDLLVNLAEASFADEKTKNILKEKINLEFNNRKI